MLKSRFGKNMITEKTISYFQLTLVLCSFSICQFILNNDNLNLDNLSQDCPTNVKPKKRIVKDLKFRILESIRKISKLDGERAERA